MDYVGVTLHRDADERLHTKMANEFASFVGLNSAAGDYRALFEAELDEAQSDRVATIMLAHWTLDMRYAAGTVTAEGIAGSTFYWRVASAAGVVLASGTADAENGAARVQFYGQVGETYRVRIDSQVYPFAGNEIEFEVTA